MEKRLYGPYGPIRGGGGSPPWAWRQGLGPIPPWPAHLPPWGFSPTWGGEEDGTPLAYIRRGTPPLFPRHTISLPLLFLPRADSPCLESAPGLEFSTISGHRSAGVGIRIRLSSAARLVWGPEGTSIVPYVYNLFEALHLWCYFIAGGQPVVSITGGLLQTGRS